MQRVDLGGNILTWVVNKLAPSVLDVVQEAIDVFRQDEKIDSADRGNLSACIKELWREEVYSEEERLQIENGKATIKAIMGSANLKVLETDDALVTLKAAHLEDDKLVTGLL